MDDWWGVIIMLAALVAGSGLLLYVLIEWAAGLTCRLPTTSPD